jgi:hypothetical protein
MRKILFLNILILGGCVCIIGYVIYVLFKVVKLMDETEKEEEDLKTLDHEDAKIPKGPEVTG